MNIQKPGIPQGMRDFNADTVKKRNYIIENIRKVFELYGFQPLETPAMENLETLMGKYGEEGDKLIFKVLNNGLNDPKNINKAKEGFEKVLEGKNTSQLTERALRYDLTIPFARFVAMNAGQLAMPYKRYQVQPVWRADRPQKGRYREFTQCDADVVGSKSLVNEVELAKIYDAVFRKIKLEGYSLQINSRKVLAGLAAYCNSTDKLTEITVAIDKLDKVGLEKVKEELAQNNINEEAISKIEKYLSISGSNEARIAAARAFFKDSIDDAAQKGLEELEFMLKHAVGVNLQIDFTLARGINYYTGIIFEVKAPAGVKMGSIGGGGRYDDLTSLFGVKDISGVGISFGIDRIYDVLEEMNLFPENISNAARVLFLNRNEEEQLQAMKATDFLRKNNIACEVYPESTKADKQFKYAEKKSIPYVASLTGNDNEINLKNITSGVSTILALEQLPQWLDANA